MSRPVEAHNPSRPLPFPPNWRSRSRVIATRSAGSLRLAILLLALGLPAACAADDTLCGTDPSGSRRVFPRTSVPGDGLPTATGSLWIGTANGLNRWNGYEFERYRYDRDRPDSLSSPTVYALHVDRRGNLWWDAHRPESFRSNLGMASSGTGPPSSGGTGARAGEVITSDLAGRVWFGLYGEPRAPPVRPRDGTGTRLSHSRHRAVPGDSAVGDEADRLWVAMQPRTTRGPHPARATGSSPSSAHPGIAGPTLPAARTALELDAAGGHVVQILEDRAHRLWLGPRVRRADAPRSAGPGRQTGLVATPAAAKACGQPTCAAWRWDSLARSGPWPSDRPRRAAPARAGFTASIRDTRGASAWSCGAGRQAPQPTRNRSASALIVLEAVDRHQRRRPAVTRTRSTRGFTLYRKEGRRSPASSSSFVPRVIRDRGGTLWAGERPRGSVGSTRRGRNSPVAARRLPRRPGCSTATSGAPRGSAAATSGSHDLRASS